MISIGVDIEEVARFNLDLKMHKRFFENVFTPSEISDCLKVKNPARHLAARFCVKEATRKALSSCTTRLPAYREIEVFKNQLKGFEVSLNNPQYSNVKVDISFSSSAQMATATAITSCETS